MALCRQMQDGIRSMLGESCCNGRAVANIGSHKDVTRILVRFFQKSWVGSIGQVVDVDHECRFCQQLPHNRRPYEAGSAGNKNAFHTLRLMWPRLLVRCARRALLRADIAAFSDSPKHQADDQAQLPQNCLPIYTQFDAIRRSFLQSGAVRKRLNESRASRFCGVSSVALLRSAATLRSFQSIH